MTKVRNCNRYTNAFRIKKRIFDNKCFVLRTLYSIGIFIADLVLKVLAVFNTKIQLGVKGRAETFRILKTKISASDKTIWMHCASLGEFEQGVPVLKALKNHYPNHKIVVSFFSPSGYENKKHTDLADVVVYLPMDTKNNAKRFLDIVNPELTLFVKYDIWPNLLLELRKRQLPAVLISASFRPNQSYFAWYGGLMRKSLFAFQHIFTQNETSKTLLEQIGYKDITVSGDTRFDRVSQQLDIDNSIDFIESFKDGKTTVIFGSSWPEDDKLFIPFINSFEDENVKFIIAPHKINADYSQSLKAQISKSVVLYSDMNNKPLNQFDIFILDTIGYLGKAYSYADIAYVGGAAGHTGLHNILEPAVFGIPIIIGKNYKKFPEALQLTERNGVTSVTNAKDLGLTLKALITSETKRQTLGNINSAFIKENKGAVIQIMGYIRTSTIN